MFGKREGACGQAPLCRSFAGAEVRLDKVQAGNGGLREAEAHSGPFRQAHGCANTPNTTLTAGQTRVSLRQARPSWGSLHSGRRNLQQGKGSRADRSRLSLLPEGHV